MERFGWTEKQLFEEVTIGFYNQVITEMNLRGQAERQREQQERVKEAARVRALRRRR